MSVKDHPQRNGRGGFFSIDLRDCTERGSGRSEDRALVR